MWVILLKYGKYLYRTVAWLWPVFEYIYKSIKKSKMETRLGILTKEQEKFFGMWLDEKVKFKNPLVEAVDGSAFTLTIRVLDDLLLEKIPVGWQSPLELMVDSLMSGNSDLAVETASSILNDKLDIPGIDETTEYRLIESIMHTLAALVLKYINK